MKNVLVIGATGFIGRHIASHLLEKGYDVYGLHRSKLLPVDDKNKEINWIVGDLNDKNSLIKAMKNIDILMFAAGYFPSSKDKKPLSENLSIAKLQTENLIEAATKTKIEKIIFTSSFSTIPKSSLLPLTDESNVYESGSLEESIYHESKILIESLLISDVNSIPTVVLNPTAVFGPGDYHLSMAKLLLVFAKNIGFFWLDSTINVVDVRDVAIAHVNAITMGRNKHRYIIGGINYTLKEWITETNEILGYKKPWLKIPLFIIDLIILLSKIFPALPIPTNHLHGLKSWPNYDNSKAISELNLSIRPYKETLTDTMKWFKENNYL
jgi:dihydroflavonol-4-reductase